MMLKFIKQKTVRQFGFSLVEMIVYISVLLFIAIGSITLLLSLDDLFAKYRAEQLVFRSATTVLERMVYDIRESESVTASSYAHPGFLTLSGAGGAITYATSSNAIHLTIGGVDQGAITESGVSVSELRFYEYASSTEFVRVEMTMSATVGESTVTRTFYSGAVLRGSYE